MSYLPIIKWETCVLSKAWWKSIWEWNNLIWIFFKSSACQDNNRLLIKKPFFISINFRRKNSSNAAQNKNANPPKRRKQTQKKANNTNSRAPAAVINTDTITDGHMTAEEVERHLQSKQSLIGIGMEAPATVPTEMFSNEPSLDRWIEQKSTILSHEIHHQYHSNVYLLNLQWIESGWDFTEYFWWRSSRGHWTRQYSWLG